MFGFSLLEVLISVDQQRAIIVRLAERIFGDSVKANSWLNRPHDFFDGKSAFDLVETEEGVLKVKEKLNQIDWGFSA